MVGDRRLLEIWRGLEIQQQLARVNSQSVSTPPPVVLQERRPILEALEARDEDRVRQSRMDHIVSSMNALAARLEGFVRS